MTRREPSSFGVRTMAPNAALAGLGVMRVWWHSVLSSRTRYLLELVAPSCEVSIGVECLYVVQTV